MRLLIKRIMYQWEAEPVPRKGRYSYQPYLPNLCESLYISLSSVKRYFEKHGFISFGFVKFIQNYVFQNILLSYMSQIRESEGPLQNVYKR